MRHAKRCTLEPTPSARQKACKNCISAKSRCDLQRPACSRCESRGVPCAYVRPVRTIGHHQEDVATVGSGSVLDANSGLGCEHGLVDSQLDHLCAESGAQPGAQAEAEAHAVNVAAADAIVSAYLDREPEFTGLSRSGKADHACPVFPSAAAGASDAMPRSEPGFEPPYSTSCSTDSAHTTPHTYSHHSAGSCGPDVRLDLDSNNSGLGTDLSAACNSIHTNFTDVQFPSGGVDSFSLCPQTITAETLMSDSEEIETWMRALAARPIAPPSLLNHRGM